VRLYNLVFEQQITKFKSLLEQVRKQLIAAQTHLDIWEQLWPTEDNMKIINAYRGFFLPTRSAHLDQFFIKVSNVVDSDPRAPSFYRLLKAISNAPNLSPGVDVQLMRAQLRREKDLLKRMKVYRNKRAAHWDTEVSEPLDPVFLGEVKQLLIELEKMFNKINISHTGGGRWVFNWVQYRDTSYILDRLRQT